jgi:hypothetical protein
MHVRAKGAIAAMAAAGLLSLGLSAPAAAAPNQVAGAAGLVAVVVQIDRTLNNVSVLSDIGEINIVNVEDSLNNLQVLNNSPILSDNVVIVQDFLNNCTVASCFEISNFLNDNNVNVQDVISIDLLSGGDINVFVGQ